MSNKKQLERARPDLAAPIMRDTIHTRMLIIGLMLGLGLTVATGRAVMLQTVDAEPLLREASRNYVRNVTLDGWRGDITDRKGNVLAVTVNRWAVTIDPQNIAEPKETAAVLASLVGKTPAAVLERIDPATARPAAEDALRNPATRHARRMSTPMAATIARVFETPRGRLDRRLDILEKFLQLEQLQSPAIFPIIDLLADAAERSAAAIHADVDRLRFFPTRGRRFAYVARDLDDATIRALDKARDSHARRCRALRREGESCTNPLSAVYTRAEARRYYPKRDLAAPLLGLVGREGNGLSGVERAMNAILAGGQHSVSAVKDKQGRRIFLNGLPPDAPLASANVELTIDQQVQAVAERELAKACLSSGARAGYAVVMDVKSGEVLAAANFPNYNPNTFQTWFRDRRPLKDERAALAQRRRDLAWAAEWSLTRRAYPDQHAIVKTETQRAIAEEVDAYIEYQHRYPNASRNAAFLDVYEPGSIMKVFTVAAALEEGVVDLGHVFDLEGGDWDLHDADDNVIHDVSRLREGDLALIIKKSSNIGAAKIAFELGAERLHHYLVEFGFGSQTHSGFPGEARGLLRPFAEWVPVELANVSFGQGMAATGIQLVSAVAALGNQGMLMQPILIRRLTNAQGQELERWNPTPLRQVVSPKTAATVLDLMRGVIDPGGTGHRAYIPGYPVAGKTGTGQKPHLRKRGYSEDMWVNTFFGLAPADDPEVAIVILIDEPAAKRHGGGLIAAPTYQRIAEFALPYLGVASPFDTGRRQAWLDPDTLANRRIKGDEHEDALDSMAPPVDSAHAGDVPVPDFRGLTMNRVRKLATDLGLDVRLQGSGIAMAQDVAPHHRVASGQPVTVTFQTRAPGLHEITDDIDAMPPLPDGHDMMVVPHYDDPAAPPAGGGPR